MIHPATSDSWGDEACARICRIVIDSNKCIAQQIIENRHDLLDLLTKEELSEYDDLGLSSVFLCIQYDQPDMLKYFHRRGLDLMAPCDSMGFGTPAFYAVNMKKYGILETLVTCGVSLKEPCDTLGQTPLIHAARIGDYKMRDMILSINNRDEKTAGDILFTYISNVY